MQPKKIRRITESIEITDKTRSFVGVLNGKPALIDVGSGFEDEEMMTGEVDAEAMRESGKTEEEIAQAQYDLEERILDKIVQF